MLVRILRSHGHVPAVWKVGAISAELSTRLGS